MITITSAYLYLEPKLPEIDVLRDVQLQVPLRVYSSDNKLMAEFGEKKREPVTFEELPEQLIQAVISAEDENFFHHPGVDYKGILRAVVHLIKTGQKGQGGSTITMQVARNFFLTRDKTYIRKINEIFLSLKIEKELSKQEIMALYMNKIYLGHRSYGVAAAAKVYYGKPLSELSLEQYAMIAGLPKAPSRYNPVTNSSRATIRRNYVLGRMLQLNYISQERHSQAITTIDDASIHSANIEIKSPYVAEMVRAHMIEKYGSNAYTTGFNVYTSVSSKLQKAANNALRSALMSYEHRHGYKGVLGHFDLQADTPMLEQVELLNDFKPVGHLKPALVIAIAEHPAEEISKDKKSKKKKNNDNRQFAQLLLKDGSSAELDWKHIKWAKKYINDRRMGKKLKKIEDVINIGDVIYIERYKNGDYVLAQIPEAAGALVSLNPQNGAINALTGGFDYYHSKFNRVIQAKRQPGSNFKPFIYSAALNKGYTTATLINDAPVVFKDNYLEGFWRPDNYSGKFFGPTRLRKGLIKSRNLVSIRILRDIGIKYAIDYVQRFGFTEDELPKNLSLALGSATLTPMQIAHGYAILANGGFDVKPWFIERIENPQHEVIFSQQYTRVCSNDYPQESCPDDESLRAPRVAEADNIFLMTTILRDVIKRGTGRKAMKLGRKDLAGKTGTTNDQLDAWFSGFNRQVMATSWVGFDTPRSLGRLEFGGTASLPMWMSFMKVALKDVPEQPLVPPENIVTVKIDSETGLLASANSKATQYEYFIDGTEPQRSGTESGAANVPGGGNEAANEELF
ncbi:penicillin-binding protein 1A [sulfur-oxidizing endosymbiont of Gigantopelta aegis]|uniref:penicillin-binding protein 1A n=1 Tax=sulfur-oxidizing endosymbiont of Gigantopelta aegis TaxID=2794934 RepID=UPI0018DBEE78|nr:penicillin-binding protein 1A [sulfur-oxidizing endosymbiont of Gigantopelta aegis]